MIRLYITLWISILGIGSTFAGSTVQTDTLKTDTISITQKISEYYSPVTTFTAIFYGSPALKYDAHETSLTQMGIGFSQDKQDRYLVQQGSGFQKGSFEAAAYQKNKGKDVLWGSASYQKGTRYHVNWNESADYALVYPYVMADSVGGNLYFEEYAFSGGYARKLNKATLGISAKYNARMEYRNVDPRPKNVTSDLNLSIGASYPLSGIYEIAASLNLREYSQDNDLKFVSQLGGPVVYHMVGLGMDNKLFAGNKMAAFYSGSGYGGQLQVVPKDKNGFFSSVGYQSFSFDKIIRDVQPLPVSRLTTNQFTTEMAYLKNDGIQQYGLKASVFLEQRTGVEDKFDNRQPGNYVKISSDQRYRNTQSDLKLTGMYGWQKAKGISWNFLADLSLLSNDEKYIDPTRKMEYSTVRAALHTELSGFAGRSLFHAGAGVAMGRNGNGKQYWPDLDESTAVYQMLNTNYIFLTSAYNQLDISARWDYPLPKGMGVYFKSNWIYTSFDQQHKGNQFLLSGGVTF